MRDYIITISISSSEAEWNLSTDVDAAVAFLEERGINVASWDIEEEEDD